MTTASATGLHTYHIVTYGCQMNDNDSEIMSGILEARGMERVASEQDADVILVNTCVVRDGAEERAINRLANYAAIKKRRPHTVVGITGCMAQKDGTDLLERVPHADLVVGTRDLFKIGNLIDQVSQTGERVVSIEDVDKPVFLDAHPVSRRHGLKALTTIMYGCNNFCTFCIVPKTRGREVSRPVDEIVDEVKRMVDQGYKEVMLLGQNVNSYYYEKKDFADLLYALAERTDMPRIRYMTSHPKDCSDKLIDAVAALPSVCDNFHLPVQSGSNRVLRRMKRFYTKEHYLELLQKVREKVPTATISTDIIVGFPDETEEDFNDTYDLLEKSRWDMAYIFGYSPRVGTKAATWIDSIPMEMKKHRIQRCLGRQDEISGEIHAGIVGQELEILVEAVSKKSDADLIGRTTGDKGVIFAGPESLIGEFVKVRIKGSHPHTLFGELIA